MFPAPREFCKAIETIKVILASAFFGYQHVLGEDANRGVARRCHIIVIGLSPTVTRIIHV